MRIKYLLVLVIFNFFSVIARAETVDEFQGIKIEFNKDKYKESNEIEISGSFATFVNCGSQYAIWSQFPDVIRYSLTDMKSKSVYQSVDNELSISWGDNSVYDDYAKKPCNKIVEKRFTIQLPDVYFIDPPNAELRSFELYAYYLDHKSNSLIFKDTPLVLNKRGR